MGRTVVADAGGTTAAAMRRSEKRSVALRMIQVLTTVADFRPSLSFQDTRASTPAPTRRGPGLLPGRLPCPEDPERAGPGAVSQRALEDLHLAVEIDREGALARLDREAGQGP